MRAAAPLFIGPVLLVLLWGTGCAAPRRGGTLHTRYEAHAQVGLSSADDFTSLALPGAGQLRAVKFIITDFDQPARAAAVFLDGHFYEFHDEWHWYQLLNGGSVHGDPGLEKSPGFASPKEADAWFRQGRAQDVDLRYVSGDRLYSSRFYDFALRPPRYLGIGSIIHMPASDARSELWAFTLEYTDRPDAQTVQRFHTLLRRHLPKDIGGKLIWVTRSPFQARLVRTVREASGTAAAPDWAKRAQAYSSLSTPGEVLTYNPGVTAGRLRFVDEGQPLLAKSDPQDILVVAEIPDQLPPCAGLIAMVPHTPLSHLNILARNRGIPSVYVGGLRDNAYFMQLAIAQAPIMLSASDNRVRVSGLSDDEYARWNRSEVTTMHVGQAPDPMGMPLTVPLDGRAMPELAQVGGKSMGLALLAHVDGLTLPTPRLALTTQAYARHVAPLHPRMEALLDSRDFNTYRRAQVLALEGPVAYHASFPSHGDRRIAEAITRRTPVIREMAEEGGLKAIIRALPIEQTLAAEIDTALRGHFGNLPAHQGLRFRSSSTIEDVEGFNGAGLYVSSTGFLDPLVQKRKRDQKRSIAWALRRTWASYWNWEAYSERQQAGMDHLAGQMAVLVHPRFDDEHELANGVISYHLSLERSWARMEVNAQAGSLSVTNPPTDREVTPEVVHMEQQGDAQPKLTRVSASSITGGAVMEDGSLSALFADLRRVAERWLKQSNVDIEPARRSAEVVLDLEFRTMAGRWPDGDPERDARLVLKQVRSLDPVPRLPELDSLELPIPGHLARRAERIDRVSCHDTNDRVEFMEVTVTGRPLPFVPFLQLSAAGGNWRWNHLDYTQPDTAGIFILGAQASAQSGRENIVTAALKCERTTQAVSRRAMLRALEARAIDLGAKPATSAAPAPAQ